MATIIEVAKAAGVSKTLVSRYVNGQTGVGPETRKRIARAMKQLNYRPNMLARSLVLQKTQTIGIVMDSLCVPYYFDFIQAVTKAAEGAGYHALFGSLPADPQLHNAYLAYFTQGYADGVVLYGSTVENESLIAYLADTGFPTVIVEHDPQVDNINRVLLDNARGAEMAVEYLFHSGSTRLCHFMGDENKQASNQRKTGFIRAVKHLGLPFGPDSVIAAGFTEAGGAMAMRSLIQQGELPQAIFCSSDLTAYGAIRALNEAGYQVPRDIRILGFDDDKPQSFDMVFPRLTTLRQPLGDMGTSAVEFLTQSINNPDLPPNTKVLQPELIIRDST